MMTGNVVVTCEMLAGHVALVTLNRPAARNAIDGAVAAQLEAVVDATERDPQVRAVVLTGAGNGVFSAGADLKAVAAGQAEQLFTERGGFGGSVAVYPTRYLAARLADFSHPWAVCGIECQPFDGWQDDLSAQL